MAALYAAGWLQADCACCWIPPWASVSGEDDGASCLWDEDEALHQTGFSALEAQEAYEAQRSFRRYEEDAECPPRFNEGDLVTVQSDPSLPTRPGRIRRRRWEHGNRTWGYSVNLDAGGGTMALEEWLTKRGTC